MSERDKAKLYERQRVAEQAATLFERKPHLATAPKPKAKPKPEPKPEPAAAKKKAPAKKKRSK